MSTTTNKENKDSWVEAISTADTQVYSDASTLVLVVRVLRGGQKSHIYIIDSPSVLPRSLASRGKDEAGRGGGQKRSG